MHHPPDNAEHLTDWLGRFDLADFLRPHVAAVFLALPAAVRDDICGDPSFCLCDYEPGGASYHVPVAAPVAARGRPRRPGRSVVLKRTLRHRPPAFVRWLIAHELAHAHLRHEGRWPGDDPEHAADALAAEWGFPKPMVGR
jgi:hypothetical protein